MPEPLNYRNAATDSDGRGNPAHRGIIGCSVTSIVLALLVPICIGAMYCEPAHGSALEFALFIADIGFCLSGLVSSVVAFVRARRHGVAIGLASCGLAVNAAALITFAIWFALAATGTIRS